MTTKPRNKTGRPPTRAIPSIPNSPENVARAMMNGKPKQKWRFMKGRTRPAS